MNRILPAAALFLPTLAWADIAPAGPCGCSFGVSPLLASGMVIVSLGLLAFRRR